MARITKTPIAIYQTHLGIELCPYKSDPKDTELICIVSHFPSALRIARQAAKIRQLPLLMEKLVVPFSV